MYVCITYPRRTERARWRSERACASLVKGEWITNGRVFMVLFVSEAMSGRRKKKTSRRAPRVRLVATSVAPADKRFLNSHRHIIIIMYYNNTFYHVCIIIILYTVCSLHMMASYT